MADLDAAWKVAGEGRIACNQVLYHLEERAIEHAVLPWCEEHGVAVVAYSPFGHGASPARARRAAACWRISRQATARRRARWRSASWCGGRRLFTIPKASSPEHAADNAGAGALRLTEAELARIDAAFPLGPRPRRLPML